MRLVLVAALLSLAGCADLLAQRPVTKHVDLHYEVSGLTIKFSDEAAPDPQMLYVCMAQKDGTFGCIDYPTFVEAMRAEGAAPDDGDTKI